MIGVAARDIGHPAFHRRPILFDRFGIAVTLPELPRQDDPRLAPARRHHIGEGLRLRHDDRIGTVRPLRGARFDQEAADEGIDLHIERGGIEEDLDVAHPAHPLVASSEEHTSELQSLMRISYAVLCLNKKTYK